MGTNRKTGVKNAIFPNLEWVFPIMGKFLLNVKDLPLFLAFKEHYGGNGIL